MAEQGDVRVKISADSTEVGTGLKRADDAVNNFSKNTESKFAALGKSIAAVFAFSVVKDFISGLFDEFGRINDLAARFGESAESIQRIGHAAEQSGTDIEGVVKALQKGTVNAKQAIDGNKELAEAFTELGINAKEFVDLRLEEKLTVLADKYANAGSTAEQLSAITKILGKSGADLAVLLSQGPEALKQSLGEAVTASNEAVAHLDAVGDKAGALWKGFKALSGEAIYYTLAGLQALHGALKVTGSFIANLPNGFAAAKDAAAEMADEVKQGLSDLANPEAPRGPGKTAIAEDDAEGAKEQRAALTGRQKYTEEYLRLQEENRKKEREIYLSALDSAQKRAAIEREIAELKERQEGADPLQKENLRDQELDKQKELADVVRRQNEEAKKAAEDREKREKKISDERLKTELDLAKDRLDKANRADGMNIGFDSARSIGGGLANVNYAGAARMDTQKEMEIQLAKKQVDELEKIRTELQKDKQSTALSDGSFPG